MRREKSENNPNKKQSDEAFRRDATAALVESSDRSSQEIAADLGVSHLNRNPRDWRKRYASKPSKVATPEEMKREMAALRTVRCVPLLSK